MRRFLSLLILMAVLGVCIPNGGGAPPLDADPNRDYPVVPQAGEWMICVAYYTGPEAPDLARQMVYQLRSKLNLPAYVYVHVDPALKEKKDEMELAHQKALKLMRQSGDSETRIPKRTIRVEEQYAVMVGGWEKVDDANKYLTWLRTQKAPEITSVTGRTTRETRWQLRPDEKTQKWIYKLEPVDPFTAASVTRNPSLPPVHAANRPDPFLKKLNEENEYSLLKCQRGWTLFVKEYQGSSVMLAHTASSPDKEKSRGFFDKFFPGRDREGEELEKSAAAACELARVLRGLNFEAYVLHMRTSSVVAVGGFNGPDDPAVARTARQLDQLSQKGLHPTLQLFSTPLLVEVPRP